MTQPEDTSGNPGMTPVSGGDAMMDTHAGAGEGLEPSEVALVRVAAAVAAAEAGTIDRELAAAAERAPSVWIEEVILQSYLFAGFPRALNAMHAWRARTGRPAPPADPLEEGRAAEWRVTGERTCAVVYGAAYPRLRHNIRALHPALDAWMVAEGYGKVLSRPQLDLRRRELCIVAACAAAGQDRQLHSHLRGARHAGATPAQVLAVLQATEDLLAPELVARYRSLFHRVLHHDVH